MGRQSAWRMALQEYDMSHNAQRGSMCWDSGWEAGVNQCGYSNVENFGS